MGRAPCCDKANVKKGPWSPEEDAKLKAYIEQHGTGGNWIALPQKIGLKRCGKSCRLRWLNYLRPNIKHGGFSEEEDKIICSLYISIGSRWSIIAAQLPGRTDNDIKNYWNTRLKKKLLGKPRKEQHQYSARRGKAEMKRLGDSMNNNSMNIDLHHSISCTQSPYWPELPVLAPPNIPYSSDTHQEQRNIDSQASMRRLLIKLGGRFSDHDDHGANLHDQFPNDPSSTASSQQLYEQALHMMSTPSSSSSPPMDIGSDHHHHHQFVNSQYTVEAANLHQLIQGQSSSFPTEIQEMGYVSNPQRLDGLEFLSGEDMVISDRAVNSCESINGWGADTSLSSSLVCPPSAVAASSEYEQRLLQEYGLISDELRYPGA